MARAPFISLKNSFMAGKAHKEPGLKEADKETVFELPPDKPKFPGPLTERDIALRKAVRNEEVDYIKFLLEAGTDPLKKDSSGMTAVDIAETKDLKFLLTDYMSLRHAARAKAVRHSPK